MLKKEAFKDYSQQNWLTFNQGQILDTINKNKIPLDTLFNYLPKHNNCYFHICMVSGFDDLANWNKFCCQN